MKVNGSRSQERIDPSSVPNHTEIVVIGGGIVGVTAAIHLAERGIPVVLCEKGRIAGEQSSRNWGWIRKTGRDLRELPLMIESARLWARIVPQLDTDIGYGVRGTTYLAENDAEFEPHEAWHEAAKPFQLDTMLLSSAETDRFLGRGDRRFRGAIHTPSDATAEPSLAVPAMARYAKKCGVTILENCAVRMVERANGAVVGVVTEHGEIACKSVILAGGVWSRTFLENLGLNLPQLAVKSSVLRTSPAPEIVSGGLGAARASVRRRLDGGYTIARSGAAEFQLIPAAFRHFGAFLPVLRDRWRIMTIRAGRDFFGPLGTARWQADEETPFERVRVFDPKPDPRLINRVINAARELHPQLADARPVETWGGMIDVMPDEIPVLDSPPGWQGLLIATGLSGHGFGIGPGAGLLAAQMTTGETPVVDPKPFSLSRFSRRAAA
ncbi:NAD(P)/FAD-dependent oxidoreductase [Nitratireductor kimnyeongensis]|uniref:NAD(P)/FAD-dependent oxidoreductase n=1 Tax=Nitratireductor kimnyeongensis TaxID=430679 RepID=A0ABW0T7U6_9HYPH|nr:FAD-binding oxidoreductase [Nitratireductor kimnyeongensis]QZZ34337.1 FAD-binding oxidoreductase [Nitratireductor kimnyeongensis]